jgi:hypothetical protein
LHPKYVKLNDKDDWLPAKTWILAEPGPAGRAGSVHWMRESTMEVIGQIAPPTRTSVVDADGPKFEPFTVRVTPPLKCALAGDRLVIDGLL